MPNSLLEKLKELSKKAKKVNDYSPSHVVLLHTDSIDSLIQAIEIQKETMEKIRINFELIPDDYKCNMVNDALVINALQKISKLLGESDE
jgi:NRPS condensation-like uncharacterized protein